MSSIVPTSQPRRPNSGPRTLPVELWANIFRETSSILNKDEFGTDPRAYDKLMRNPPVQSSLLTQDELQVALRARFHLVLVCKYWRDIALPILYSHFRLRVRPGDTTYQSIHKNLAADSRLTNSVRRVTVVIANPSRDGTDGADERKLRKMHQSISSILSLFPRPEIISANPTLLWTMPLFARSRIIIADLGVEEINCEMKTFHSGGWDGLVRLALTFTEPPPYEGEELTFPSLQSLDIRTGSKVHFVFIKGISRKWNAPKLHTFGLYTFQWTCWRSFLERHASTITILNIRYFSGDFVDTPPVNLPALCELYMDRGTPTFDPRGLVEAPHLERVTVYQRRLPPTTGSSIATIERALLTWERAPPIHSYFMSLEGWPLEFLMKHTVIWALVGVLRRRGSEVVFLCDQRECHAFGPMAV